MKIYFKLCNACCGKGFKECRQLTKILLENGVESDFGNWSKDNKEAQEVLQKHNISGDQPYIFFLDLHMMLPINALQDKNVINLLINYGKKGKIENKPKEELKEGQYRVTLDIKDGEVTKTIETKPTDEIDIRRL